jgi:hypothetical protein
MKQNHSLILLIIFLTSMMFSGCAPKPSMYYWGDYPKTLYASKKNPNDETLLAHKQSLENIIEQSKSYNLRVPPGVYAELGYFYFRTNNDKLASQYFTMEENLYPESKILMTRFKQALAARKEQDTKQPMADDKTIPQSDLKINGENTKVQENKLLEKTGAGIKPNE